MKHYLHKYIAIMLLLVPLMVWPVTASAAYMSDRSLSLSSNLPSTKASYTIRFRTATTALVGSIRFQFCTTRFGSCYVPVGIDTMSSGVTLDNQFGMAAFTYSQPSQGELLLVRSSSPEVAGTLAYYTFGGITNPSFSNVSFFVRIYTYSSSDGTGPEVDEGGAVASLNSALNVEGVTPETLSFCIGTVGNSCADVGGQLLGFGDFLPTRTATASTIMFAATNAPGGYSITMFGNTMASGANTIPAMGAQTQNSPSNDSSKIGSSQFGTNLAANTAPSVGANVAGSGIATAVGGYGTPNRFRFFSGDTIASSNQPSDINRFTNSYIVNIAASQPIGFYTGTLSYVCTGNF